MTATLPAILYGDAQQWPRERAAIFAASWQLLAHESELRVPGDFVAATVAGWPVVVVRDGAGTIRAFHNVCRHRAGPLTATAAGNCGQRLTCRYHGWEYALDGRLAKARDFGPAEGFDARGFSLEPLTTAIWRGFVFGAIAPDGPLAELLAPLDARLDAGGGGRDWGSWQVALKRQHAIACDWKVYVENYLEGYHVPTLHPGLDAEVVSEQYRVAVEGRVAIHDVPSRGGGAVYEGLWAWVWPNLGVNVYGRGLMMERINPQGPGRVTLDYLFVFPEGEAVPEATLAMSEQVTAEDAWICERVQENLAAGIYGTGVLSARHENGVAAFQRWVTEALQNSSR